LEPELGQRRGALAVLASRVEEVVLACPASVDVAAIAWTITALAVESAETRGNARPRGLVARRFVLSPDTPSMERAVAP
jgi:hypothetical protein